MGLLKPAEPNALVERFWSKVNRGDASDCWPWLGTKRAGYGLFKLNGRHHQATRVSYEMLIGKIPQGASLDHLCRNTACVNPDHLDPVSHRENVLRGIGPTALNSEKAFCKSGHPLSGANLYIQKSTGYRYCRQCAQIRRRKYEFSRSN